MLARAQFAITCQMQGEATAAQRWLAEAQQLADDHHLPELSCVQLTAANVDVWLAQGDRAALTTWSANCGLSIDDALSTVQEPAHYAYARALLGLGQPERALQLIDRLQAAAAAAGWLGTELEARVLRCTALQQLGRSAEARTELLSLLPHAEAAGRVRLLVERGPVMYTLLRETLPRITDAVLRQYVERVIVAFDPVAIPSSATKPAAQPLIDPLSERECEVLRLVADGLSDRQIADRLVLAIGTVKRHLNNVYGKLGVNSRTQALARAREIDLL
jgi:LuxR family maltose regulon positive regulatory protein